MTGTRSHRFARAAPVLLAALLVGATLTACADTPTRHTQAASTTTGQPAGQPTATATVVEPRETLAPVVVPFRPERFGRRVREGSAAPAHPVRAWTGLVGSDSRLWTGSERQGAGLAAHGGLRRLPRRQRTLPGTLGRDRPVGQPAQHARVDDEGATRSRSTHTPWLRHPRDLLLAP